MKIKTKCLLTGLAALLNLAADAQTPPVVVPPGKLAIFKGGDNTGVYNISTARVQPCFVEVYDPAITGQTNPLWQLAIPTNAPNAIWMNAHAGSEGGGISRSANRQFLALQGYTGNILSPTAAKPSAAVGVTRGFGLLDVFGNETVLYSDPANWFGLPPGVTQNNPTGIATTDGTNFWGTGNVTGTSSEAAGTLFYNASVSPTPLELQNYIQAAAEARIINGTLYVVVPGSGVYNFLDPQNDDAVVPLPFDPSVPSPVQHIVLTNLFLSWGSTFQNIANFDMNRAGTVAYGADETFGIVKFLKINGAWQQAPYYFGAKNIGTTSQTTGNQGCFGICVDFSGPNPVIYATTMENGTTPPNNSQGNPNQNRLISIVDLGDPGTNLVAQTLATAGTTNETFRGVDFTPDLSPLVASAPLGYSTTNGGTAYFSVATESVYPVTYQWLENGIPLSGQTSSSLQLSNVALVMNQNAYQCVAANQYGSVTSAPVAVLTVTALPQGPVITNTTTQVTAYVGGTITFPAVNVVGTQPFSFRWLDNGVPLTDDGVKFSGSSTPSLTISNLVVGDSGNYFLVVTNAGGATTPLLDVLTVKYALPVVASGQPQSLTTFAGLTATLTANQLGGTPPFTNQWYKGSKALTDGNEFSGTATSVLTISPAATNDAGGYKIVISNSGGSVTSQVATVTVLVPPAPSFVGYSNQVYYQTFDSLPDPGSSSVNSINNPKDPGSIKSLSYSLANPFDFAYPVVNNNYVGGLGLGATLAGWYGAADTVFPGVDGITRFGAQNGDQTTGGVIDFGPNDHTGVVGTNRALGLLSTSTTGSTTYAVKLVNQSGAPLNYVSLAFIGELWHNGTGARTMSFGYTLDSTATNFTLTSQSISNSTMVPNLAFSFPTATVVTAVDGTQSSNQVSLVTNNLALSSPWQPNAALWLIWAIDFYGSGSGNGYAIDNLSFYASASPVTLGSAPFLGNVVYSDAGAASFSFTNAPGARFSVYSTTNLVQPKWISLGAPTETPNGAYSTYQFTDPNGAAKANQFFKVTSP